jgi:CYTH domain-containing protein
MLEIERKYIIKKVGADVLYSLSDYTVSEILQIYLDSDVGVTHRIRRRKYKDITVYTETEKLRIDKMSAVEREREISESEFLSLSEKIKQGTRPINKRRHTFEYGGHIFEIDEYPEWKRTAILETELEEREETVDFPDFIEVLAEVTGDGSYSNAGMAREFPRELLYE